MSTRVVVRCSRVALLLLSAGALLLGSTAPLQASVPAQSELARSRAAIERFVAKSRTLDWNRGLHVHPDLPLLWQHHQMRTLAGDERKLVLASSGNDVLSVGAYGLSSLRGGSVRDQELAAFRVRSWNGLDRLIAPVLLKAARVTGQPGDPAAREAARAVLRAELAGHRELVAIADGSMQHAGLTLLHDLHVARQQRGEAAPGDFVLRRSLQHSLHAKLEVNTGAVRLAVSGKAPERDEYGQTKFTQPWATREDLARFRIFTAASLDRAVDRAISRFAPEDLE